MILVGIVGFEFYAHTDTNYVCAAVGDFNWVKLEEVSPLSSGKSAAKSLITTDFAEFKGFLKMMCLVLKPVLVLFSFLIP